MTTGYSLDGLRDLHDFFVNAPVGLHVVAPDGTITHANQADLHLLGYAAEPERYVGHPVAEFHDDQATIEDMLDRLTSGRPLEGYRARLRHRDGSPVRVVVHSSPRMNDDAFVSTRCFTFPEGFAAPPAPVRPAAALAAELDAMSEDERRARFDLLDDFFENAPVALHIVGPDGIIRRANRLELESLGYTGAPGEYVGHHIAEFHASQDVIEDMLERLVSGRPLVHYEANLRHRGGATLPVFIYSSPRIEDGEFLNTRCFTFPKSVDDERRARVFSWPRNDEGAQAVPAAAAGDGAALTSALKRMAGRRAAEESLGFLSEAGRALAASADHRAGAEAVAALAVPFLADWCSVELRTSGGMRVLGVARGPRMAGMEEEVRRVVHGGGLPDPEDSERAVAMEAAPESALYQAGVRSLLVAPFSAGGATGVVALARGESAERGAFGAADAALAEDVARRVGMAVELGRLRERVPAGVA